MSTSTNVHEHNVPTLLQTTTGLTIPPLFNSCFLFLSCYNTSHFTAVA